MKGKVVWPMYSKESQLCDFSGKLIPPGDYGIRIGQTRVKLSKSEDFIECLENKDFGLSPMMDIYEIQDNKVCLGCLGNEDNNEDSYYKIKNQSGSFIQICNTCVDKIVESFEIIIELIEDSEVLHSRGGIRIIHNNETWPGFGTKSFFGFEIEDEDEEYIIKIGFNRTTEVKISNIEKFLNILKDQSESELVEKLEREKSYKCDCCGKVKEKKESIKLYPNVETPRWGVRKKTLRFCRECKNININTLENILENNEKFIIANTL